MAKNSKPILSVLIDEDKRTKFADLARRNSLSMGYLINQTIDRMLAADSIDIYGETTKHFSSTPSVGVSIEDVEKLINSSIATLHTPPIDSIDVNSLKAEVNSLKEGLKALQDDLGVSTANIEELKKPLAIAH